MRIPLVLLALTSACITTSDPRRVEATWSIEQLAGSQASTGSGSAVACPAGWVTARLVLDGATGTITDDFPCDAGSGVSSHVPDGSYAAQIDILDAGGNVIASSVPTTVEVDGFGPTLETRIFVDAGYAELAWTFPPNAGTCDGINPFEQIYLSLDGPSSFTQVFSCHDTRGITSPMLAGEYHASVSWGLIGHGGWDMTIEAPNRVTQLPTVKL
ncbi:MAG TPA: hypothetical protein VLB44_03085 [Kofleriaceae bacterium]|nr:hypothetical protein [Kofleriaceae bacterium]